MNRALLIFLLLVASCTSAQQQPKNEEPKSPRIANIEDAASRIAVIQEHKGADGAFEAIFACYAEELPKARYVTPGIERCMTQDIIVSKISAEFYRRISPESRKRLDVPEPDAVIKEMSDRVISTFRRLDVPEEDAIYFNRLVEEHGMAAYGKTNFPKEFQQR